MDFLTNLNLNKNELQNAVIQNLGQDPQSGKVGQIYYNTTDQMMYQYKQISSDPDTFAWVTVGRTDYLSLTGGTMSGDIDMNSNSITNLPTPVEDDDAATKEYVDTIVANLPEPMIFKGSIGSGGTIEWSALPAAASTNEGFTYKVITAHATAPICEVGDTIISDGTNWVVIPSGDEPSGTVTSIGVTANRGLATNTGSAITTSGTIGLADNYGDTVNPYASKTKNYVLAAPSNANGVPSFRALVASDIPVVDTVTDGSMSPITSNAVYNKIQEITNGSTYKTSVKNSQLTADANGVWTWIIQPLSVTNPEDVCVTLYNSSGEVVYADIAVTQSGDNKGRITIQIIGTANATLAANTYKAVIVG